jgi:hypothetical protein
LKLSDVAQNKVKEKTKIVTSHRRQSYQSHQRQLIRHIEDSKADKDRQRQLQRQLMLKLQEDS